MPGFSRPPRQELSDSELRFDIVVCVIGASLVWSAAILVAIVGDSNEAIVVVPSVIVLSVVAGTFVQECGTFIRELNSRRPRRSEASGS